MTERIFFEEKQKLPGFVPWAIILTGLALCFPLAQGLYLRTVLNQPWGEDSMTNVKLLLLLLFLLIAAAMVAWWVTKLFLEIKVSKEAVSFRYFPFQRKMQMMEKGSIDDYIVRKLTRSEIRRKKQFNRSRKMTDTRLFRMSGTMALEIHLQGGRKLLIGTQNPEGLLWAMKKLMSNF